MPNGLNHLLSSLRKKIVKFPTLARLVVIFCVGLNELGFMVLKQKGPRF